MKILVITQRWYPDSFGGSELVAAEQARRLAERGHEVTVVTENAPSPQSSPTRGEEANFNPSPATGRGQGEGSLHIYRYGSPKQFARIGGRSRTDVEEVPRLVKRLNKLNKEKRVMAWDIAILHHPFAAYGFFKAGLQIPTFYIFHASIAKEAAFEKTKRWPFLTPLFVWWARRVERTVFKCATRIAVFSEFSRRLLCEIAPEVQEKVVKLSAGVDLERFHNPPQPSLTLREGAANKSPLRVRGDRGVTNLLTVRRLTPRMGLIELVRAMRIVVQKMSNAHLTIVGEGPMREALEREVERLGLQSCVTLAGRVAADKLPRYYQQADLFVLPTQAYEGLGMATLEALASGLPVVGTPVGATPEVLGDLDSALVMRSASAEDITQGILDFFARPVAERESLGKKARDLAEQKYNWEVAIDQLEKSLALCAHKAKL